MKRNKLEVESSFLLLTTEAVVTEVPEDKKKGVSAPMPGGDMDY